MEVVHRIALHVDRRSRRQLADMGIEVLEEGFVAFDVLESSAAWPEIRVWIRDRRPSDIVYTRFTDGEVGAADWVALRIDAARGYPQPREDEFGYREATYDMTEFCEVCGIGLRQRAPFQMKGEPGWGRRGVMQLNWVYDEFFVRPDVWASVFEPYGVAGRPVSRRSGVPLATVTQLVVDELVPLDIDGIAAETCDRCGRLKYLPIVRGPIAPLLDQPNANLAKSAQWFGSGGSAWREAIASRTLLAAIRSSGIRGASFIPLARS